MSRDLQKIVSKAKADRENLLKRLRKKPSGYKLCLAHTELLDNVWRVLLAEAQSKFDDLPPLSIVATGGYGRREMAPWSDVDVAFVPMREDPRLNNAVRWLFNAAHDSFGKGLGIRVAYVNRLITDIPGLDSVNLSNLLDARLVAGSSSPFQKLQENIWIDFPTAEFLLAKLQERQQETAQSNTTPLVTEPHLKNGAGGLRDFHAMNWIGQALGERPEPITPAVEELLMIRNLLHLVVGNHHDELNYARREEIAGILKVTSFTLGSRVARALDSVHENYHHGLNRLQENRYDLGKYAQAIRGEIRIQPGSPGGQAALAIGQATKIGLTIPTDPAPVNKKAGPEIIIPLTAGIETVRNLERSGVLKAVLPELSECRTLMPGDASHKYTVYEHTLQALRFLEEIPFTSPFARIYESLPDSSVLKLAILFHDLGKAIPGAPHSEVGEKLVHQIGKRWSLDHTLISDVAWLVREHLTMAQFIRVRDIDHPDTVLEFSKIVGTVDRLSALTLLTYADINAVNSQIWSPVQETYLLSLFERTAYLLNPDTSEPTEQETVQRILRSVEPTDESSDTIAEFLEVMPTHYLLSTPEEIVLRHHALYQVARKGEIVLQFQNHRDMQLTELTISMPDRSGILPDILGTLYAHNLSLQSLRCSTSEQEPGTILDTFLISRSDAPLSLELQRRVERSLRAVLSGETSRSDLMTSMGKDPNRRQQFLTIDVSSQNPTIIEVRAPKGRGLAYRLCQVIHKQGLNILSARLGQWAGTASAGFYVYDPEGRPIDSNQLRRAFHHE
ncbi:MAG: HD domain-containing protein [Fimbriimonadaceae bacterium]|nr:HD domain-containing protein [Fimbriimonadaceae bacterium]